MAAPAAAAPSRATAGKPARLGLRTLHMGMRGGDVALLQRELAALGFQITSTGYFGRVTAHDVAQFKRQQGLTPADGMFRTHDAVPLYEAIDASTAGGAQALKIPPATPTVSRPTTQAAPAPLAPGQRAVLRSDGTAIAPASAPLAVQQMVTAGNKIATLPYRYGGGHGSWNDTAYDCSGSVSYVLHGAGLLDSPLDSGSLESWGRPGAGQWVTIYANSGHTFMYVAGLRFDTSGAQGGSRWQTAHRATDGYVVVHPPGL
ncbi:MAG: peptidoglycan-binding domain-containing protein [Solirubrobacteraceae bacterium]|nr:MAG: hypothetical protein DLM63_03955 [Solirubrobacterales bacterium]